VSRERSLGGFSSSLYIDEHDMLMLNST